MGMDITSWSPVWLAVRSLLLRDEIREESRLGLIVEKTILEKTSLCGHITRAIKCSL
jgi:hypothetical protein